MNASWYSAWQSTPSLTNYDEREFPIDLSIRDEWVAALERLAEDADAPLPK